MKWAAAVTWFVTIDGGIVLVVAWLRGGGLRRSHRRGPRIGPELVGVHLSLAATAFGLWIAYLADSGRAFAVAALCLLVVVATIGFTMFGIWLVHRVTGAAPAPVARPEGARPLDQRLPVPVIILHGVFAATTLVLVAIVVLSTG